MNNKQLYQDTFSQVQFTGKIDPVMLAKKQNGRSIRRLVILAAVICLLAAFGVTAGASGMLRLQGMVIRQDLEANGSEESIDQEILPPEREDPPASVPAILSLSGFSGTPEKQAVAEWQDFLNSYDTDYQILNTIGNKPTGLEEKYGLYYVYTQEMADKLEEIAAKYGLKLHNELTVVPGTWSRAAGGTFLPEIIQGFYGYMYEDGSFHFDGEWNVTAGQSFMFQFGRWVKGYFNEVTLSIGYAEDYREWTYMTACGVPVTLAIAPNKSLVLMEGTDAVITVNVLEGSDSGMTEQALESFADSIDFIVLSPVRQPVLPLEESVQQPEPEWMYRETGIREEDAQDFYCSLYLAVEEDRRRDVADFLAYPAVVSVPQGEIAVESAEEFLPYYDDVFHPDVVTAMLHNQYTMERADLFVCDGQVCGAGGEIRFGLVNGEIKVQTVHIPATSMGLFQPSNG